jgi:heme-degrading monooxygenase HmoA
VIAPTMFVRIWRFRARADRAAEFEAAYGSRGAWTALFRRGAGYLGTEFLESTADPAIYITVDRWESADAWESFLRDWSADYTALDRTCEELTEAEEEIGAFLRMSSP